MAACLHRCPSCARHVRANERACPFCDAALPEDFGVCSGPGDLARPLSRAALLFVSAAALAGCGKRGGDPGSPGSGVDIYGPAPIDARDAAPAPSDGGV